MSGTIPLSVVIPVRDGYESVAATLDVLGPQVASVGGEIIVVDGRNEARSTPEPVRWIPIRDDNLLRLRARAIREARGDVVAIGEDHAIPHADWCEAVLRAHSEHPEAPAIVGCLVNATASTVAGRANFLAFAAPYAPPMPTMPVDRPPPVSAVSLKRRQLAALGPDVGSFETDLVPRLYADGQMVVDDRIRLDHYQDHGFVWSVTNRFHVNRAAYGNIGARHDPAWRRATMRWLLTRGPQIDFAQARAGADRSPTRTQDLLATAAIIAGAVAGAVVGSLAGPGRSANRMT